MPNKLEPPEKLLRACYTDLHLKQGSLLDASARPTGQSAREWLDKGKWIALAESVGAEKVFFVQNDPVIVFAKLQSRDNVEARRLYNNVWCMARPRFLFLARPGLLEVYDLAQAPVQAQEEVSDGNRRLHLIRRVADVQQKLQGYRREQIESGYLFAEKPFEPMVNRADKALIRDLSVVRDGLVAAGLAPRYAHALIGRSIFIRYLEDRQVLIPAYFDDVASKNSNWASLLSAAPDKPDADPKSRDLLYPKVLADKQFTYALFERLSVDFNGDMFPSDEHEEKAVTPKHLHLLQGFLRGDASPQHQLFFFAYKFDIIPIELISSIYEEFYTVGKGKDKTQRTHYTPSALVEFVLSQVLTRRCLARSPRILDGACGSGIFLVEAFRRIVRYRVQEQKGRRLTPTQLRKILREQIAGIDINEEAIRVAAFSLYLAFLHYQEPREINAQRRLPHLKWQASERGQPRDPDQHLDILLHANTFAIEEDAPDPAIQKRFASGTFDVAVGNPPWGEPKREDTEGRKAADVAFTWCKRQHLPVGDKELSQAFVHRTIDLLREGGIAGLLVSSGVFFKQHKNSREFRQQWLSAARLLNVTNLAHVRHIFFSDPDRKTKACAPFASVVFEKADPRGEHCFEYWSAKLTAMVRQLQAVVLARPDLHLMRQSEVQRDDTLWKIYWWGSHRDANLIGSLGAVPPLTELPRADARLQVISGQGFTEAKTERKPSGWLRKYRELPIEALHRYGAIDLGTLRDVPHKVKKRGVREVYDGVRLLVRRGIVEKHGENGRIIARLASRPFCFRNSINAFRLNGFQEWQQKTLLGIFWSSLARYYFFLTAGSWGMWHHELHMGEIQEMPICFPEDTSLRSRIVQVVDELREGVCEAMVQGKERERERQLDEAIFDLYELTDGERDLVRDMCDVGLDLFYRHQDSDAVKPVFASAPQRKCGVLGEIPQDRKGLNPYLRAFLRVWNRELEPDGEFNWRLIYPEPRTPVIAIVFSTQDKDVSVPSLGTSDDAVWTQVLHRLDQSLVLPTGSRGVYIDGLARVVRVNEIIIVKRNERRFWTASMAREDAEATLLQAMHHQEADKRK